jgi:hypothetical protein
MKKFALPSLPAEYLERAVVEPLFNNDRTLVAVTVTLYELEECPFPQRDGRDRTWLKVFMLPHPSTIYLLSILDFITVEIDQARIEMPSLREIVPPKHLPHGLFDLVD